MAKQHSPRFLEVVGEAKQRVRECSVEDVWRRLDRGAAVTLVDVREESEYSAGYLPGAVHIGKGVIERDIEAAFPNPDAELVLYCGGGFRSALAADSLQRMGYTNVLSMSGGWSAWCNAGHPVERPTQA